MLDIQISILPDYCAKEPSCCTDQITTAESVSTIAVKQATNMETSKVAEQTYSIEPSSSSSSIISSVEQQTSSTELSMSQQMSNSELQTTAQLISTHSMISQQISIAESPTIAQQTSSIEPQSITQQILNADSLTTSQDDSSMDTLSTSVEHTSAISPIKSTNVTQETTEQNKSTTDSDICICRCFRNDTITPEQITKEYKEILKSITRPKNETSLAKRKLTSAKDPRMSAAAIGYVGLIILIIPVALIIISDIQRCFMKPIVPKSRRSSSCVFVKTESSAKVVPDIRSV